MNFAAPLWLLGLTLLPAIRWLHRGGPHRRAVAVSHLGLWQGAAALSPAAGRHRPPDPAWRRRALLAAFFFVALSQPQWVTPTNRVTLWIDDSLSMLTREPQGTRLTEGMARARALVDTMPHAEVEVRALTDPWRSLGPLSGSAAAAAEAGAGRREPRPPPAALLRRDRLQWLLTDGADLSLLQWPGARQPDTVIQVASVMRNVGLERLAARRSPIDPGQVDLLLRLVNGGSADETRVVVFATGAGEVTRSTHRIEAGGTALVELSLPSAPLVRATLQPPDALPEDDTVELDLSALRRRPVALDPACPASLVAAVSTHPALRIAPAAANDIGAALECEPRGAVRSAPTIRVLADRVPTPLTGSLQWSADVPVPQRIGLDAGLLRQASRLQAGPRDAVLLAAGGEPLIVRRHGTPAVIDTSLDFVGSPGLAKGAQTPLLVDLMFEAVLDSPLLEALAVTDRGAGSSAVVPKVRDAADRATSVTDDPGAVHDWARPLAIVALLLLLWEAAALARQWRRLRALVGADSG